MPYSSFFIRWLWFDALFIVSVVALDFFVKKQDIYVNVLYFYAITIVSALVTFGQVVATVYHFVHKNTERGFFYLFHFVLWLVMTWLMFVIHLFLFVGAPSAGAS